ncbi:MAG TPA: ABC transporter permease subunit [Trebonia sp.]|nr:ABC transporter permease subunit [Trebonia sp.]
MTATRMPRAARRPALHRAAAARSGVLRRIALGAAGLAVLFGVAQLAVWLSGANRLTFPLPSTVLGGVVSLAGTGAFWSSFGGTVSAWAQAMAATIVIAVPVGLLLGSFPAVQAAIAPVIEFLRPIPSVVLVPTILLIVQDPMRTQVVAIVFAAIWPVLINTISGVRNVDPVAVATLRSFGFGPLSIAGRVALPSAAPFIATGIRIAASLAFIVAVAVELVSTGVTGLGSYASVTESGTVDLTPLLALAVWSGLFGLVINGVLAAADRRLFRWHHALTAQGASR